LAQQLKVETKTLVDAIKSMGIDGKGSALASLTEDEVKKVKAAFQKTASKPNTPGLPNIKDGQPLRHVLPPDAPVKKIPVIDSSNYGTRRKDDPKDESKKVTHVTPPAPKDGSKDQQSKYLAKTPSTDAAKQSTQSTAAPSTTKSDTKVEVAKTAPVDKLASVSPSSKIDATNKGGHAPVTKNISVTKKESDLIEPATLPKTPSSSTSSTSSTVHDKSVSKIDESKIESKEAAQKRGVELPKTTHQPNLKHTTSANTTTTTSPTNTIPPQQPKISQVGKIVTEKDMPKLPPAIGHIDISSIQNAGRSNHRGGGGGGQGNTPKSSGNRDSRNRSNPPLNSYLSDLKKNDNGKHQQQQQNNNSQRPQNQQQKQGQNQKQFNQKSFVANQQATPLRKPLTRVFETAPNNLTRDDNYWKQRTIVDNKIPDLDGKRKKFDGETDNKNDNKKDNKFTHDNKQDTNKQQANQNNKKPQAVNIFLAPIPTVKTKKHPKEPQAQKPDKRLPVDIIRNVLTSGSGTSVDEFIRKHKDKQQEKDEARRARDSAKKGGGRGERSGGSERIGERGSSRGERDRDRNRDRVGERLVGDRGNKDTAVRLPDRGEKSVKTRLERDRHGRGNRVAEGSSKPESPFFEFGGSGRTIRDSSRIAEEKRRIRAKKRSRHANEFDEEAQINLPRQLRRVKSRDGKAVSTAAPRKNNLVIHLPCTVKQFAEQTGTTLSIVIKKLLELGIQMQLNSQLDVDAVELLAEVLGIQVLIKENVSLEDRLVTTLFEQEDDSEALQPRPPVVTVLGHVDHGKTTMLDNILKLNVVSGEKGGITQHIRAYRVKMENGEDITFVDTPGHEAFTEMRARGAGCTDIAVLVVAADDGVMPQTEEAISHAKAAGVPIIVAINKMDLPSVNPDRVIQELAVNDLLPEEWGGDVPMVRCSGLTGMGLDKLLETIQIMAEMHELKANPNRAAIGVALEAELQSGQGAVCKVIVQNGTLRTGDIVLCGTAYGRVKAMYDTLDTKKQVYEATPSTPVNLVGLDIAPGAGSRFCVLEDISDARMIAEQRQVELRKNELAEVQSHVTLETLFQRIKDSKTVQTLNVIIRADVRGSIEAIRKELAKLSHPEVKIKILQATVGGISEADVHLADASDAIIVGFNVVPDENARVMAERKKIQVRRYDIIYNLTDDIKKALEGMLKPLEHVKELGRAVVQQVFTISRVGTIAGCKVVSGIIERDCKIRVIRESRIIGEYPLDSLKREKDDVKEIRDGYECGIKLKSFNDLKTGDILEAYKIESIARTF
jgi:translation initiation factor IF-2